MYTAMEQQKKLFKARRFVFQFPLFWLQQLLDILKRFPAIMPGPPTLTTPIEIEMKPKKRRRNAVVCRGRPCPNERMRGPLRICRPYLWVTNISHLIMMLEMRIARSHSLESDSPAEQMPKPLLPLEKVDEVIGKDIDEVLRTGGTSDKHKKNLKVFITKVQNLREVMRGVEGFGLDEGLADVIDLMKIWREDRR